MLCLDRFVTAYESRRTWYLHGDNTRSCLQDADLRVGPTRGGA
jgi:hypothetical protein